MGFITTKGAGHTQPGIPYIAKWKDKALRSFSREVPRPEIISKYFKHCNIIDVNNQARQFELGLEKMLGNNLWLVQVGYHFIWNLCN